ncbi:3-hydroxyacyl-[acyl-carrier-protein] dehydratase FabZ [Gottschalkia purinilytica]|uniref:3-hydroxyacyl-[acyl-carrier-protein] dehydratase FabZ n=1 Tax=Gottschalkia purinilytica TaxID=1503 RepID=A0A0L0WDZ2_GOTPU|nr:3-hydroxyacyl-ACP dehydratase FabZ [Gottschalkia purinilytica]KNF09694.1 3-hydroxyacyl-[acyl-carrier-protein] dehydratase FabZ [Gottschalkia purinilytica]
MIDNIQIQNLIPHRYPFLLVDKVVEIEEGKRAVGIKNVAANEPFFQGHFPGNPIMPGVLIVEAMAQVGAVTLMTIEENREKLAVFTGIDGVRIKKQVRPGDTLRMEVELVKFKRGIGVAEAVAYVDGEIACKGTLMFALIDQK